MKVLCGGYHVVILLHQPPPLAPGSAGPGDGAGCRGSSHVLKGCWFKRFKPASVIKMLITPHFSAIFFYYDSQEYI